MTDMNELFELVTKIIGNRPGTGVINDYDKIRAVRVFLAFDEFLIDNLPGYCEEKFDFDFQKHADKILDELEGK